MGLLSFRLLYHTRTYQQTMGHPDTHVHYFDRVNVSTRPYYPANVKIRIEAKKDKVWSTIFFTILTV